MVPRVAMFTMAGETFLIIGDREGTGVSPTDDGMVAETGRAMAATASNAVQVKGTYSDLTSNVARGLAQNVEFMAPIIPAGDTGRLCRRGGMATPKYVALSARIGVASSGTACAIPREVCLGSISCRLRSDGAARPGSSESLLPEHRWSAWL